MHNGNKNICTLTQAYDAILYVYSNTWWSSSSEMSSNSTLSIIPVLENAETVENYEIHQILGFPHFHKIVTHNPWLFLCSIFFRLRELNLLISTVKMWHFVRGTFSHVAFCPGDILSCAILSGWHFVLWHFVRVTFCPVAFCPVTFCPVTFCPVAFCPVAFCPVTFCPGAFCPDPIYSCT